MSEVKMQKQDKVKSYRDLIVWQKAHGLTKKVIVVCSSFPHSEEARVIKRQLLRSSTSIAANIAEGYGGNKGKVVSKFADNSKKRGNRNRLLAFIKL